ncbi:Trehalose/maltose import ATP-binding protein MalK [Sulfuracidifex tepidarius]|nr:Trehalose/maltose import ATP-binding protein MalK [Sulfuracidifex tepidarius]
MTVREALSFFKEMIGGDQDKVIQDLELQPLLDKKISQLSQGQKKRVSIAKSMMLDYNVILMDEPTENLDPEVASKLRQRITQLSKDKVILYTSHNLYEARELGRFVIVLNEGKISTFLPISELRTSDYEIGIRASEDISGIVDCTKRGDYFVIKLKDPEEVNPIIQKIMNKNIKIYEIKEMSNPLEDLLR